jgi:hypothetical protein
MANGLRSGQLRRLPLLAGWLFADLFLVLFLVGLASSPPRPHPPKLSPHPTASPTPTPPRVLDRTPVSFHINVPPTEFQNQATRRAAKYQLLAGLNRELRRLRLRGRQAGFVLVFASGPQNAIGQAVVTAKSVVKIVRAGNSTFAEATGLGYWSGSGNYIKFVVFFFARPGVSGG